MDVQPSFSCFRDAIIPVLSWPEVQSVNADFQWLISDNIRMWLSMKHGTKRIPKLRSDTRYKITLFLKVRGNLKWRAVGFYNHIKHGKLQVTRYIPSPRCRQSYTFCFSDFQPQRQLKFMRLQYFCPILFWFSLLEFEGCKKGCGLCHGAWDEDSFADE